MTAKVAVVSCLAVASPAVVLVCLLQLPIERHVPGLEDTEHERNEIEHAGTLARAASGRYLKTK